MKSGAPQADNVPAMGACGPCGAGAGRSSARNRRNAAPGNASPILQPAFGRSASSTRRPARAKPAAATAPAGPAPAMTASHMTLFPAYPDAPEFVELGFARPTRLFEPGQRSFQRLQCIAGAFRPAAYRFIGDAFHIDDFGNIRVVLHARPRFDDAERA